MALYQLDEFVPQLADGAWVADSAQVIGNVVLAEDANVWFGAVLRGDNEALRIGRGSNVQDGTVMHTDMGYPLTI
ncbi:gamma carbonic anhydrase family protein, partial [Piscinibacter sp.]|uniref:gamma carbonic anhydrase family protein n=1 Tax=Piscinibacter sp. TaxID=1903157 RepID=UPI002F707001